MEQLDIPPGGPRAGLASASYRTQRRSPGMDAGTRRLALISGGLGGALVLIVGFWSMSGHHGGAIPVIQADQTPLRVKPDNPGGQQFAAGDDILSGSADSRVKAIAPGPEKPDPAALRAQGATPPAPAAAPVAPPAAAPSVAAAAPPAPKPVQQAAKPHPAPPPVVAHAAAPVGVHPAAPVGVHGPQVQLASMSSEQAAHEDWERLTRRMPDLLGHRHPAVARTEVNGHVFWRLRTAGFADASQASSFCDHVRAKGGDCSVADF
jgi:hypothetical protein